jgi:hypothetical protein
MVFPAAIVKFVNGIYFEPTGAFLFLSNRFPIPRVTVVTSTGAIVQHLMGASDPVGIGFSATSRLLDLEDSSLIGRVFAGGDIEVWSSTSSRNSSSTIKPQ